MKKLLLRRLQEYKSENVFNPYSDICDFCDYPNASEVRLENLSKVLDAFIYYQTHSIWIGRDLGYRGGRRTGIAFTDEFQLEIASHAWKVNLGKATKGEKIKERTATNVWNLAERIDKNIFMWNIFPFHPYENNNPFTNRKHTYKEREAGSKILDMLLELVQPKKILTIGNDAYNCVQQMFPDIDVVKIRHPSYGGEKIFSEQISNLYKLDIFNDE